MDKKSTDQTGQELMNEYVETTGYVGEKLVKRASVSLTAGEGAKLVRLTILAQRKSNGTAVTTVTTTDAKKKATRGMTTKFETFELAVAAMRKLEHDAVQKGWKKSLRAGGFKAKPDAFSSMPVAPKVTK